VIVQSIYTIPGVPSPTIETTEDDILQEWKKICNERSNFIEKVDELNQTIETNSQAIKDLPTLEIAINQIEVSFSNFLSNFMHKYHNSFLKSSLAKGRRSAQIESELELFKKLNLSESLSKLHESLISIYENQIKYQVEIEETLNESLQVEINNIDSIKHLLGRLSEKISSYREENAKLKEDINSYNDSNSKRLNEEIEALKTKHTTKMTELETRLKTEHSQEIENARKEHEDFILAMNIDFNTQNEQLINVK
jgi:hypothetical protein